MVYHGDFADRFDQKTGIAFLALCLLLSGLVVSASAHTSVPAGPEVRKLVKKATKLLRAGLNEEAETILRKALELEPESVEVKAELGRALTKQRRVKAAYDICFPEAQKPQPDPRILSVLGETFMTAGRFQEARTLFNAAIAYDRKQDLAWAGSGMLDFYENKITNSLANLQTAVFQKPEEPDYVFAYAQVAARGEHYKDAALAYDRFLQISRSTDKDRRERIQGLIRFLNFLGDRSGLYVISGGERTTVPFELEGNRPVIRLKINGNPTPLRFVLDTGSGISVLSEATAKRLKVKAVARGGHGRGIGGDGKFEIVYGQLKTVDVADVRLKNVPIYIRKFHGAGDPIDGYIGLALISKFLTTIDYGDKTFTLTRREADREDYLSSRDISIPLRLTSSGFLSGEVQLKGVDSPLSFIVDTGASISVISDALSRGDAVSPYVMNDETLRVIGSAGITGDMPTFLLPRISFGDHSIERVKAVALNLDLINEASGFEQAGILGGNFLKNYRMTFDFQRSKVTFVSVTPAKE